MADSKFANLPGIAYDQPDVYETADDIPGSDQSTSDYYEEPENEHIERIHISTKDAHNRFRDKYLSGYVDFSDRIGKRSRPGYDAVSTWELSGEGEKETALQKCRRLQCEMSELLEEVAVLQGDSSLSEEEKQSYAAVGEVVCSSKLMLDNLRLEQALGKEVAKGGVEAKKLLNQVVEFKKNSKVIPALDEDRLAGSSRLAELDQRLHTLEKAIGARPEKLSRLSTALECPTLIEGVQQLATKAALLQPAQVDLLEARLQALIQKMDALSTKAAGADVRAPGDQAELQAKENNIKELYDMAKRTEPVAQTLPDLLRRMQALESLHQYANNFSKLIGELESTQTIITSGIGNNKKLLQKVQEAFAENMENINQEVAKLDARLKSLEK